MILVDGHETELRTGGCPDHEGLARIVISRPRSNHATTSLGFCADSEDIISIAREAHESAGAPVPLMIGRPDLAIARRANVEALIMARTGTDVTVCIGSARVALKPFQARQAGAYLVALAELPDDPDPADVDALTKLIEDCECIAGDTRELARRLLASGLAVTGRE